MTQPDPTSPNLIQLDSTGVQVSWMYKFLDQCCYALRVVLCADFRYQRAVGVKFLHLKTTALVKPAGYSWIVTFGKFLQLSSEGTIDMQQKDVAHQNIPHCLFNIPYHHCPNIKEKKNKYNPRSFNSSSLKNDFLEDKLLFQFWGIQLIFYGVCFQLKASTTIVPCIVCQNLPANSQHPNAPRLKRPHGIPPDLVALPRLPTAPQGGNIFPRWVVTRHPRWHLHLCGIRQILQWRWRPQRFFDLLANMVVPPEILGPYATVDGRNQTNQLIGSILVYKYPIYVQGFIHPRWCRISEPSTVWGRHPNF